MDFNIKTCSGNIDLAHRPLLCLLLGYDTVSDTSEEENYISVVMCWGLWKDGENPSNVFCARLVPPPWGWNV